MAPRAPQTDGFRSAGLTAGVPRNMHLICLNPGKGISFRHTLSVSKKGSFEGT